MFKIYFENTTINHKNFDQIDQSTLQHDWESAAVEVVNEWFGLKDTIVFQTSGSTGKPKEIEFSRDAIKASAHLTASTFALKPESKVLLCLHPKYVAGKMMLLRAIINGWELHLVEPAKIPKIEGKYDFAAMVPMQVEALIDSNREKIEKINRLIVGGAPISERLHRKILHLSNSIYATYGMTETLTHVAIQNLNGDAASTYFVALKGINLNQDSKGCLTIQANHLGNAIIKTNDVVEFVDFNKFLWKGRFDHVINSGGVKIHPEVLEKKLEKLIDRRIFISGQPDEALGTQVVLFIEGEPYDKITFNLFQNHLAEILSKYEIPKKIIFLPQFEETVSGKIIRKITK